MSTKLSANAINGIESVQVGQTIVVGEDENSNKILEYGGVVSSPQMDEVSIISNIWDMDYNIQSFAYTEFNANATLTVKGTTNANNLRITHLIRIDNSSTSNITITLSKGTNIDYIRCLSNQIVVLANNSLELSCYITKESISGTDKYVANVTEYNELQLY